MTLKHQKVMRTMSSKVSWLGPDAQAVAPGTRFSRRTGNSRRFAPNSGVGEFAKEQELCCDDDDLKIASLSLHTSDPWRALNGDYRDVDCLMGFCQKRCGGHAGLASTSI
jgi:hypothetical protein